MTIRMVNSRNKTTNNTMTRRMNRTSRTMIRTNSTLWRMRRAMLMSMSVMWRKVSRFRGVNSRTTICSNQGSLDRV